MPPKAFFLRVPGMGLQSRFCIFHEPRTPAVRGAMLYVHPLAEEMNKARRMAAIQSRALADAGFAVLQIDLYGCGDSSGDFGDADWKSWLDDVLLGVNWLRSRVGAPLWLWGLRAGCLVAVEAARSLDTACHFLLWQPPNSGRQILQQFLRMKRASSMLDGRARETLGSPQQELERGQSVDVGGYRLSTSLAEGLGAATLAPPPACERMEWLSLTMQPSSLISGTSATLLAAWRQAGAVVRHHAVVGPQFWTTVEIEYAPELVKATLAALVAPARVELK